MSCDYIFAKIQFFRVSAIKNAALFRKLFVRQGAVRLIAALFEASSDSFEAFGIALSHIFRHFIVPYSKLPLPLRENIMVQEMMPLFISIGTYDRTAADRC
jgi:hypothetical protein